MGEKSPNAHSCSMMVAVSCFIHILFGVFMRTIFANGVLRNMNILKSSVAGIRRLMKQGSRLLPASNSEIG